MRKGRTNVSNKRLHKLMRKPHIIEDHRKVILRRAQEVRAEHNRQRLRRHMVMLLALRHTVKVLRDTP